MMVRKDDRCEVGLRVSDLRSFYHYQFCERHFSNIWSTLFFPSPQNHFLLLFFLNGSMLFWYLFLFRWTRSTFLFLLYCRNNNRLSFYSYVVFNFVFKTYFKNGLICILFLYYVLYCFFFFHSYFLISKLLGRNLSENNFLLLIQFFS